MWDTIDPRSPTPLYEQIASRIRVAIAAGNLEPGDALPSVRQLARELRVNPATVAQAYRDLAAEGLVEMRHGSGTFVQDMAEYRKHEEVAARATELVRKLFEDAARLGIGVDDVARAFAAEAGVEVHE